MCLKYESLLTHTFILGQKDVFHTTYLEEFLIAFFLLGKTYQINPIEYLGSFTFHCIQNYISSVKFN